MPIWILKLLPYLGAMLIVGALLGFSYSKGKDYGVQETTIAYEKKEKDAKALAQKVQETRQKTKDVADEKGSMNKEKIRTVYVPIEKRVIEYVKTPSGAVECLDTTGSLLTKDAIDAANASITKASE